MCQYVDMEILNSWRRCTDKGLSSNITSPLSHLDDRELELTLKKNEVLLSAFRRSVEKIHRQITGNALFALTDANGILLCIKGRNAGQFFLKEGMSLSEESFGTNAIALAILLKKKFYLIPHLNYCNVFRETFSLALPLSVNQTTLGTLTIIQNRKPIHKELQLITELLSYNIAYGVEILNRAEFQSPYKSISLNRKQLDVLLLLARGMTEKAAALEIGISMNTIRYHKRIIFKKMDTNSMTDAVIKAIKQGLISLNEI